MPRELLTLRSSLEKVPDLKAAMADGDAINWLITELDPCPDIVALIARAIADDLRTYNSSDLLQEHLILLTTVYARTLQELLSLGPDQQDLRSPTDLPESERQRMWDLCLRFGLTATRLRVEGWIYQLTYGEPPSVKNPTIKRR